MATTVDALYQEALSLSEESRVALAERLIESVEPDPSVIEAQMAVVQERLEELDSGRAQAVSGADGLRRVREAVAKRAGG